MRGKIEREEWEGRVGGKIASVAVPGQSQRAAIGERRQQATTSTTLRHCDLSRVERASSVLDPMHSASRSLKLTEEESKASALSVSELLQYSCQSPLECAQLCWKPHHYLEKALDHEADWNKSGPGR